MKTEVGHVRDGKLKIEIIEHDYPAQLEIHLLARKIGRSMVRFARPVAAQPKHLQSLAAFFAPTRA
jgi:hypothetical protein